MMEYAKDYLVERRTTDEFEGVRQEAEKLISEIERMFPQVEQIVASSDFGRDAIGKARGIVERSRQAIAKKDAAAMKEQMESLTRTHRMFKGVVARPQGCAARSPIGDFFLRGNGVALVCQQHTMRVSQSKRQRVPKAQASGTDGDEVHGFKSFHCIIDKAAGFLRAASIYP